MKTDIIICVGYDNDFQNNFFKDVEISKEDFENGNFKKALEGKEPDDDFSNKIVKKYENQDIIFELEHYTQGYDACEPGHPF